MKLRVEIELTPKQLDKLASMTAYIVGRENPRKAWTDQERKQLAREWVERQVLVFLEET